MTKIKIADKLKKMVDEWRQTASEEDVPIEGINVNMVSLVYDFCRALQVSPSDVLGDSIRVIEG